MQLKDIRKLWSPSGALMRAGPYLLIEILLPGGTLIALLLFLYRRRQSQRAGAQPDTSASRESLRDGLEALDTLTPWPSIGRYAVAGGRRAA